MSIKKHIRYDKNLLVIALAWGVAILLVNPLGEFPLNDDWAYATIVKKFVDTGEFRLINWGEMTLVSHLIPAAVMAKLFGFSFIVLRFTTLVFSFLGLWGVYRLLLLVNLPRQLALFTSLVVLACPVYMALSFSYMTDLPFMTFCVWAIFYFVKADLKHSSRALFYATLLTVWAMLSRQLALVIPFAWFISHLLIRREADRSWNWKVLPFVFSLLALLVFNQLMSAWDLLPDTYGSKLRVLQGYLQDAGLRQLRNTIGYFALFFVYVGLFLSPLLLFLSWKEISSRQWWLIAGLTVSVAGLLILSNKTIPAVDNIFINFAVGPNTMADFYGDFRTAPPGGEAPIWLRSLITLLGAFFGSVMVVKLFDDIRTRGWKLKTIESFLIILIACYMGPFMITGYYDRYLILMLPLAVILLAGWLRWHEAKMLFKSLATVLLALFLVFSVAATHDYMSWNRLRWVMIGDLQEKGIDNGLIGGGAEFACWYFFDNDNPTWWERDEPRYQIRFSPGAGQEVLEVREYSRWLPGENEIVITQIKP